MNMPQTGKRGNKALGAVDRIKDPDIFRFALNRAEFLANDAMIRKCRVDEMPHRRFGGPIGLGHRIEHAARVFVIGASAVRKNGRIVSAAMSASFSTKAAKSTVVIACRSSS